MSPKVIDESLLATATSADSGFNKGSLGPYVIIMLTGKAVYGKTYSLTIKPLQVAMAQWENLALMIRWQQIRIWLGNCCFIFHDVTKTPCRHFSLVPRSRIKAFMHRPQCCIPRLVSPCKRRKGRFTRPNFCVQLSFNPHKVIDESLLATATSADSGFNKGSLGPYVIIMLTGKAVYGKTYSLTIKPLQVAMAQWENLALMIRWQQIRIWLGNCCFIFHDVTKTPCRHFSLVPRSRIKAFMHRPQCCIPRLVSPCKRRKGRFTRPNFCVQLSFNPLFQTTIGHVNANFSQVSSSFCVLDESRT